MTGLSLRLWHDRGKAPVEGGGTLAERGRAPDSSFQDYIGTELFSFLYDHAIPLIRRGDVCFCALYALTSGGDRGAHTGEGGSRYLRGS